MRIVYYRTYDDDSNLVYYRLVDNKLMKGEGYLNKDHFFQVARGFKAEVKQVKEFAEPFSLDMPMTPILTEFAKSW